LKTIDLIPLLPVILVSVTAVALLIEIAVRRNYQVVYGTSLAGILLSGLSLLVASQNLPVHVTPLLVVDTYGLYFVAIILVAAFSVTAFAYPYFKGYPDQPEEFFVLLLTATLGAMVLALSNHFVSFFLGLELLSISLYGMIAYPSLYRSRIEASIKYLVLAGITSSFLLFGMALIYISMGTMDFSQMSLSNQILPGFQLVLTAGWGLLLVGLGFELALVPFQFWTPDVYQGAPVPVTAFIATISKGGAFAMMLRYFSNIPIIQLPALWNIFAVISIASMLFGNIIALVQTDLKRILAYSSISHLGYILVAFLASGIYAKNAVAFYLAAYFITTLIAFGVITSLSRHDREFVELKDYHGLFWKRPWQSVMLTAALLSLAGIPPTAGIIGKIFLAAAGVESALWPLLIVLVFGSIVGLFYYLRIITTMFRGREESEEVGAEPEMPGLPIQITQSPLSALTLIILFLLLIGVGIYPTPLLSLISRWIAGMAA
jgi:NADH-quinone oxidoreductase subunit N